MQRPNPIAMYRLLRRAGASPLRIGGLVVESILRRESRGVHRLLALHDASRPGAAAVVQGERRVAFADLALRVRRLAGVLGARGLGPGDRVVTAISNSAELLVVTGALRTIGAVRVPASPAWRADEIAHCLSNSGARGIAFDAALGPAVADACAAAGAAAPRPELAIEVPGALETILSGPDLPLPPDTLDSDPDTPAIVYTSGTTGRPKGARPRVRDLAALVDHLAGLFRLGPAETILCAAPLSHAAPAAIADLALVLGATLVLPRRFDAEEFLALIERERVTFAYVVPYMLQRILELPDATRRRHARPALRGIVCAAAPLRPETRIAACDLFGDVLMEFYGSTETGVATFLAPEEQRRRPETVGRAIAGVHLRILDEAGAPCATGEVGEVAVKSGWLSTEYVGMAGATLEAHRDGYFRTGDLGSLDPEGYLTIRGRLKDMVNTGGTKVFPAEVERAIAQHPEVRDAAVFPLADPRWGEAVAAAVVRAPGSALDEEALKAWLKDRIASYKVPKRVFFEAELPRNPQGKVLKRTLRESYERERQQ